MAGAKAATACGAACLSADCEKNGVWLFAWWSCSVPGRCMVCATVITFLTSLYGCRLCLASVKFTCLPPCWVTSKSVCVLPGVGHMFCGQVQLSHVCVLCCETLLQCMRVFENVFEPYAWTVGHLAQACAVGRHLAHLCILHMQALYGSCILAIQMSTPLHNAVLAALHGGLACLYVLSACVM